GGTPYAPTNEDGKFHGVVSVREALANSYNIPAVQVLSNIGIGQVIKRAHQMGINSINDDVDQYGLSLALGSSEVSVLDMTYAYSVFANGGIMAGTPVQLIRPGYRSVDPVAVLRIEDRDGNVLWQFDEQDKTYQRQNVLPDSLAYLVNDILSDNEARLPAFGPGNALQLSRPAAAKTGTTNDARDAWTVGYTPQLSVGTWVGNNNNSPMSDDIIGANAAAPIWHAIMEYGHHRDNLPVQGWARPATIIQASVCKRSGLLPTPDCPAVKELFYADANVSTVPTNLDNYWRRYQVNARNGLIATSSTAPSLITEKIFFDYPVQARDWAKSVGEPLPPTDYDSANAAPASGTVAAITTPGGLARVRQMVSVTGNINSPNVQSYTLAYGIGINPTQWIAIGGGDPTTQGQNIVFGKWDTNALDGLYTLRLSLTLKDNVLQLVTVQVTVDNKPPAVKLIAPQPGQSVAPDDKSIALEASATDNVEVDHVEFYHNGNLIDTEKTSPYRATWQIDGTGAQSFYAIAYDSAGNSARSDSVQVTTP
ncbi:MAG TPA: Ig-like domain-containing protein, partial [Aggregatilineales bacterium]|nr:Ig-like domain-containing protein [Aggregatilineales bacterium]